MKTTKKCIKCGSLDLLFVPGTADGGVYDNAVRGGMTIFSGIPVNRFVCCNCGFTEEWIDREYIPKLRKRYQ